MPGPLLVLGRPRRVRDFVELNSSVLAAIGDEVEPGRPLVTLEAMKMEHVHKADLAGRITAITVGDGDQVGAGQVLVEIEAPAAAG